MSFDFIAPHYRWMEFIAAGPLLQRCRLAFIEQARNARNILVLGEGNGRFLVELLKLNATAQITVLDASARMIELARRRIRAHQLSEHQVRFVHQAILDWPGEPGRFDLVVSHFFLDCFPPEQLKIVINKITASTCAEARWLVADFRLPNHGWQRHRARLVLWLMYHFFRQASRLPARYLTNPETFLEADGFFLAKRTTIDCELLHSDLWVKATRKPDSSRQLKRW